MPFAYYRRLSTSRRATYRRSDRIEHVPLPSPERFRPQLGALSAALEAEHRGEVEVASQAIADEVVAQLGSPGLQVVVLEVRPHDQHGELHGLYEPSEAPYRSRITLWMRTARREQPVAFRTFLRTLLHEILHHLDYEHYELAESFHTEGFFKRESSLFRQLTSADPAR